ncbi:hypothetical protein A2U01_0076816, partial [Trifolium medium]|nr:hypothetical protein [Trifolium medium]
MADYFWFPGEHWGETATSSLTLVWPSLSDTQEHTRSLRLGARLAQRPCIS